MKRRTVLSGISSVAMLPLAVHAQSVDSRPIRIVVPVPPGGPIDVQARVLATELAKLLRMNVIVDNKPGASTMIGSGEVAKSAPDGKTLLYTNDQTFTQVPHTLLRAPFDPLKDLVPVMRASTIALCLITHSSIPGKTVREFVEYARQNPGKLAYATYGPGTPPHVFGVRLAKAAGLDVAPVPYKGVADAVADLVSGRVQFAFTVPSVAQQYEGRLKTIGVIGTKRSQFLPDVPTMAEQGYAGFEGVSWIGLFAPAGTRPETVNTLRSALATALKEPPVIEMWKSLLFEFPGEESLADTNRLIKQEHETWGRAIRDVGVVPQ